MIKQVVHFSASPSFIYNALMDEKKHSEFTGASAKIDNQVGGAFSVWDGYAEGKNIELVPGKKIVQSWRANDWPSNITSTVIFIFEPDKKGTKLTFTHEGVPTDFNDDVKKGWEDYYWKPLKDYLAKLS